MPLPIETINSLYDDSGNRIATQSTVNGTTTLTSYIGSVEEVQASGSSTQTTTYYAVGGKRVAADVNGTFYYFGYDALGSQVAVLNATGSLVGAQLYGPYGASRYNTGTIPTSIGFTGQRADSVTGLDYYVARYYDPGVGQFLSADSVQGNAQGMDPYAYVGGNPESRTDPTGNRPICGDDDNGGCGGGGSSGGGNKGGSGNGGGIDFQPPQQNNGGDTTQPSGGGTGNGNPKIVHAPASKKTATGCDPKCQAEKRAAGLAKSAADQFQTIANWLGGLAITIGLVATALFAASFWAPVLLPWAIEIAGLAAALGIMSYKASEISHLFSEEAANDLSWFTQANLNSKKNEMLLTLVGLTLPSLGSEFVLSKIGDIVEQSIRNSPALLKDLTPSLSFKLAGGSFAIADVIGTAFLAKSVVDYTNQQEEAPLT